MMMAAIRQNAPSQMSSAPPQMSFASVYQTAMKAAPMHKQIRKPVSDPSHTYRFRVISWSEDYTCFIRRRLRARSSSPIAFLMKDRRTETITAASRVSAQSALAPTTRGGPRKTMKKIGTEKTLTVMMLKGQVS
jgi:hypothetical protein